MLLAVDRRSVELLPMKADFSVGNKIRVFDISEARKMAP